MAIQDIINRHFPPAHHPFRRLEREIIGRAGQAETILDIGCGHDARVLQAIRRQLPDRRLIGIDPVAPEVSPDAAIELIRGSASDMSTIADASIDLAYSRSVMEHVEDVAGCYREIARVLKPGGSYVFLTPSRWDYVSIIAQLVPNRLHGAVVRATEGRPAADVFPTYYRSNSRRAILEAAGRAGFDAVDICYCSQYPAAFMFSESLFRVMSWYHLLLERFGPECLRGWILCSMGRRSLNMAAGS
jgi:ubiquinone/menaquinone biosynthesis C-methylase UbiE